MSSKPPKPLQVKSIQRKDNGQIFITTSADGESFTTTSIQPLPSMGCDRL